MNFGTKDACKIMEYMYGYRSMDNDTGNTGKMWS